MEKVKIIIEIKDGAVYSVESNTPMEYVIINRDVQPFNGRGLKHMEPDIVQTPLYTMYNETTDMGMLLRDYLFKRGF